MPNPPSSAESKPEPDLSGRQLGDYQILRRLGRGGMAEVYLAEQASLRRQVALKVLKSSLASDDDFVRRFHNEAQAAAALVHANIVQIHEVGCIEGVHFIAQEYVSGQNLRQVLTRQGALDALLAINVLRQVTAALHKAAEQGIIHRDIKPENIMIASSGEVKVADFGLARVTADGEAVDLTQVGITMGTPLYMSPEQVEGNKVDPRSDLYSLGVTCYHMLAGRAPFEGDSPLAVAVKHLKTEPERLENVRRDLPEGLCRIIHRLLAKDPADRFQRPADLLRELRSLQIEGLEDTWSNLEEWTTPEWLALAHTRNASTEHLDDVMKTQALVLPRPVRWPLWGGVGVLALLVGALGAWLSRPDSLLSFDSGELRTVERKDSAFEQYWLALSENTEEAYQAVAGYHPPTAEPANELYAHMAKQKLAEYYRQNAQNDKSMQQYAELAELASRDPHFAAIGLIGQANLLNEQDRSADAISKLSSAVRLWGQIARADRGELRQGIDESLRPRFDTLLEQWEAGQSNDRTQSDT